MGAMKSVPVLRIDKDTPTRGKSEWRVTHVPTGALVGRYPMARIARAVRDAVLSEVPATALASTDMDEAAAGFPEGLRAWIRNVDSWPDRARWEAHLAEERARKEALQAARDRWAGVVFHYVEGSLRYGRQGKILSVEKIDPPENPELLVCCIEWSPDHSSLGATLYLDAVAMGPAPDDMPWYEIRRGWEWRARIRGGIYCIARVSDRQWVLWNKDVPAGHKGLPEYQVEHEMVFPTLEAAQAAALEAAGGNNG